MPSSSASPRGGTSSRSSASNELDMMEMMKLGPPADEELRVLIITATYFVLDGVTLTIRRLESHLRSIGATVKVMTTVPEDADPADTQHLIQVPGIPLPFMDGGYAMGVSLDDDTIRKVEEFNPNCVHITVPDFVGLDGIRWCQRTNTAFMATFHSNLVDYLKYYMMDWLIGGVMQRYMKGFYEQIPSVYVPTPYMQRKMENEGFGRFTSLKVWGRGCDLKIFRPDRRSKSFRQSKGIEDDDVVILWVGRLVPEKRPDIWLQTVRRLQDEGIKVKAMVVGHGSLEKSLAEVNDLTICGWLSGLSLAEAYASCDVLLFPSGVETFGNVTLEALASGCVAIVEEKCSGHLVSNGHNGYTCPDGDYEAYYQATKSAVTEHANRKKMSENARESAWAFERTKISQQMVNNYKEAIVAHRDPSFLGKYMNADSETSGKNILSTLCCDYWIAKAIATPFLQTLVGTTNLYHGAQDCVSKNRHSMSCGSLASLDYSSIDNNVTASEMRGESNGAPISCWRRPSFQKYIRFVSIVASYLIFSVLIWYSLGMGSGFEETIKRHLHLRRVS